LFGGNSISAGEIFTPPSNPLFDFGVGDSWPQTFVQNFGKTQRLRELLSVDWIRGEDSWLLEQIKEKSVLTRDPFECESAIKAKDNILSIFSITTLSGRYASNPPKRDHSG